MKNVLSKINRKVSVDDGNYRYDPNLLVCLWALKLLTDKLNQINTSGVGDFVCRRKLHSVQILVPNVDITVEYTMWFY